MNLHLRFRFEYLWATLQGYSKYVGIVTCRSFRFQHNYIPKLNRNNSEYIPFADYVAERIRGVAKC